MNLPLLLRPSCLVVALLLPSITHAQNVATGTIAGRIFNPATGQYVRDAQVRIEGTNLSTISEGGGVYRLTGVPPGDVTLVITFTGYETVSARIGVAAGTVVTRDFQITATSEARPEGASPIRLSAFTVSTDREGNAKAIMNQRNSMNITNSVASDAFGDVAEGHVGEFLKHLPGVTLNLVEGEPRTISLRGLGAEYTAVTLDGVSLASADANAGAAGDARAFSFEQASLSSMEMIEISKTISADVDANAPAGTINLKSKRAFDREGRRVSWQLNTTAFGRQLTFDKTPGPDDHASRKILPGGIFEYSDVFLNRRLGLVLNISESNVYSEITYTTLNYDERPTPTDPRPAVVTQISTAHGPRTNQRSAVTLTSDFKLAPNLVLSLGAIVTHYDLWFVRRDLQLNAGARTGILGSDPLTSFTSSSTGRVSVNPLGIAKLGKTYTYLPRFEYKQDGLTIEGRFSYSDSESTYKPQERRGSFMFLGSPAVAGVTFTAQRSAIDSADWQVRQVAGPDIGNGANFTSPTIQTDDGRYNRVRLYSADVFASLMTRPFGFPVAWKAGLKKFRDVRDFDFKREAYRYNYTGPGAGVGAWAGYRSPFDYDYGAVGASLASLSNQRVFYPNLLATTQLFRDRPEYFTQTITAANYYSAYVANRKHYEEDIDAAFLMATTRPGKFIVRAGLRWEKTSGDSLEFDPRSASEVRAAGFPTAAGRATTIPGLDYQYFSNPRVSRTGSYDRFFPSGSVKYRLSNHLDFHFGYSSTIRRPTFRDIAGVTTVNDDTQRVSLPNPNLKPETSDNFSLRGAYYFEPVGNLAINFFQNNVQGLHRGTQLTAEEFGNTDPDLAGYTFFTTVASAAKTTIRGMELEYSQSLSFLPRPFSGLNVRASYTRNYASVLLTRPPHAVSAGLNYSYKRLHVRTNLIWQDDQPINLTGTEYVRQRTSVDMGGDYRLTARVNLFLSVRNVFNEPYNTMRRLQSGPSVSRKFEIFGTNYTFGIKGVF